MFLRSKARGARTYWQVVETYREGGRVKHRTVYSLGHHETRASAQAAWDEAARRGHDRETLQVDSGSRKRGIFAFTDRHIAEYKRRRSTGEGCSGWALWFRDRDTTQADGV